MALLLTLASSWSAPARGAVPVAPSSAAVRNMSVEQYAELALSQSLRIRIARDNLESSRFAWLAARRDLVLPRLTATANASESYSDSDVTAPTRTDAADTKLSVSQPFLTGTTLSADGTWMTSITRTVNSSVTSRARQEPSFSSTLTQPLFLFVRNPRRRAQTRADIQWANSRDQFENERLSVAFEAKDRYFTALLRERSIRVEERKSESSRAVHSITREMVKAGKLAPVELSRADIRLNRDLRRIQNAKNELVQEFNRLKNLVLLPPEQPVTLSSPLSYVPLKPGLERLLQAMRSSNPALLNAWRQIELAKISLQESREGTRPRVDVSGTYAVTRDRADSAITREPNSWSTRMGLTWAFYDATQTALRVDQSRISLENSRRAYESLLLETTLSVRNAFVDLKRIETQIQDFEPQRESVRRNLEAVRLQYQNGLTRLIDLFDAENELRDLELEYLNLLLSYNRSLYNLSRLVGVDVEALAP